MTPRQKRIKGEIAAGTYETPLKIDYTAGRLLELLSPPEGTVSPSGERCFLESDPTEATP